MLLKQDTMYQIREHAIDSVRRRLLRRSEPSALVFLILMMSGMAGFITSFSLLHLGLPSMGLRYPVAVLIAYCVFLLLLWFWLSLQRSRKRGARGIHVGPDVVGIATDVRLLGSPGRGFLSNSDFSGTSASRSWGDNTPWPASSGSSSSGVDFDPDSIKVWLVILALAAVLGALIASLYIVYIAPALLAEILVDGVLIAGLHRSVKRIEQRYWLRAAVRKTWIPAFLVAVFFMIGGFALPAAVPGAQSVGDVWNAVVWKFLASFN